MNLIMEITKIGKGVLIYYTVIPYSAVDPTVYFNTNEGFNLSSYKLQKRVLRKLLLFFYYILLRWTKCTCNLDYVSDQKKKKKFRLCGAENLYPLFKMGTISLWPRKNERPNGPLMVGLVEMWL